VKFGPQLTQGELERMRYPTQTWSVNRAVIATRLERKDHELLALLSALFAALSLTPLVGPLADDLVEGLPKLHARLSAATLGLVGSAVVYGPKYAIHRRRSRETAARTAGQRL